MGCGKRGNREEGSRRKGQEGMTRDRREVRLGKERRRGIGLEREGERNREVLRDGWGGRSQKI